jgi:pimeloyl-ACP methyl ester carboxylesterase
MHLNIDGRDIHVVEGGGPSEKDTPALVFIHGAGGDASIWQAQMEYFGPKVPSFAIELPGHGGSSGPGEEDIGAYVEWVRGALTQGITSEAVVLIGHSMGGAVVQTLALDPPEVVRGIVLVGTGAKLGVMPAIFRMLEEDPREFFEAIDLAAFCEKTPREVRQRAIEAMRRCSVTTIMGDFRACDRFDVRGRLERLQVPTFIICGENDRLTPLKYSEYLQEHIPGSRLFVLPEAGHMVMVEKPLLFNKALEDFLLRLWGDQGR